jgi:hypothetical protein
MPTIPKNNQSIKGLQETEDQIIAELKKTLLNPQGNPKFFNALLSTILNPKDVNIDKAFPALCKSLSFCETIDTKGVAWQSIQNSMVMWVAENKSDIFMALIKRQEHKSSDNNPLAPQKVLEEPMDTQPDNTQRMKQ